MSKKRTNHLRHYETKEGFLVATNSVSKTYHLRNRSEVTEKEWKHLLESVARGEGAPYKDMSMLKGLFEGISVTHVMG